ncbi:hypothetical protein TNCV_4925431 [Trichonephila clavipes]|nr:hypothetical protein TNCV_4925431 [Trichonephila clavipes]
MKEAGSANRRIARRMGRSDAAIRRCWQEQVDSGRFKCNDGSSRPRQVKLNVRSAVTAPGVCIFQWNVDDLTRQLEQLWQEIPQEIISVFYHPMPRRVAACIQARSG